MAYNGITKIAHDERVGWIKPNLPRVPKGCVPELLAIVEKWAAPKAEAKQEPATTQPIADYNASSPAPAGVCERTGRACRRRSRGT